MKDKFDNPSLDNLQMSPISPPNIPVMSTPITNPHASHPKMGAKHLDLGIDHLFDAELGASILNPSALRAGSNRLRLEDASVVGFSIIGLPGVGKTTLIEKTFEALSGQVRIAVLEAETNLEIDTTRLQLLGIPVLPVMTTHAEAIHAEQHSDRIADALAKLDLAHFDALFIEETASLLTPPAAASKLHKKVAILTITNGEDIPRKHPWILTDADCVVITKTDLLPHLKTDLGQLLDNIEESHPGLPIFDLSAQTGDGMEAWVRWLVQQTSGELAEEMDMMYAEKPVYVPFFG